VPLEITGKGIGLIGDSLIFENKDQQFMVCLGKFLSYLIEFDQEVGRQHFKPSQINLFG
jgi:hypothetical protein